jgi:hypothetical protein
MKKSHAPVLYTLNRQFLQIIGTYRMVLAGRARIWIGIEIESRVRIRLRTGIEKRCRPNPQHWKKSTGTASGGLCQLLPSRRADLENDKPLLILYNCNRAFFKNSFFCGTFK